MECKYCDTELKDEEIQCASCGSRLDALEGWEVQEPEKSRFVAATLALLLGALGVHKFYLGAWGAGVLYFLFAWTPVPYILAITEGIRYLLLSEEDFANKVKALEGPFSFLW